MANTRDVVHSINTWRLTNARSDHLMSDLTEFLMKVLAGTMPAPEASHEPLTTYDVREAVWNGQTSYMADTRRGSYSQDMAPTGRDELWP